MVYYSQRRCYNCFTLDVVGSVAFGTEVDSQKNPDDPFVKNCRTFFEMSLFKPLLFLIRKYSPPLSNPLWLFSENHSCKTSSSRSRKMYCRFISEVFRIQPTAQAYPLHYHSMIYNSCHG